MSNHLPINCLSLPTDNLQHRVYFLMQYPCYSVFFNARACVGTGQEGCEKKKIKSKLRFHATLNAREAE